MISGSAPAVALSRWLSGKASDQAAYSACKQAARRRRLASAVDDCGGLLPDGGVNHVHTTCTR
jgi:hypothetical protein